MGVRRQEMTRWIGRLDDRRRCGRISRRIWLGCVRPVDARASKFTTSSSLSSRDGVTSTRRWFGDMPIVKYQTRAEAERLGRYLWARSHCVGRSDGDAWTTFSKTSAYVRGGVRSTLVDLMWFHINKFNARPSTSAWSRSMVDH